MATSSDLSEEAAALSTAGLWKGENDSDAEQMEAYDSNPLANAGAWSEKEAYSMYRERLINLRTLYTAQLTRLKHSLAERRREFLLEWMAAGGDREDAVNPSRGGTPEDVAYRNYRRRSGEEAVLERRQKQRQVTASIEFFSRKDIHNTNRAHHQHLLRLQGQYMPSPHPTCSNVNCDNKCIPLASKCRRHICADPKQLLYTSCIYVYPSGAQCVSPVAIYMNPPLCGGHCDMAVMTPPSLATVVEKPLVFNTLGEEESIEKGGISAQDGVKSKTELGGDGVNKQSDSTPSLFDTEQVSLPSVSMVPAADGDGDSTVSVIVSHGRGTREDKEEPMDVAVASSNKETTAVSDHQQHIIENTISTNSPSTIAIQL